MQFVGIDCRFASEHTGLGTYTRSLVSHLLKRNDPWSYVLFVRSEEERWLVPFRGKPGICLRVAAFPHYSLSEQIKLPELIHESGCILYYAPHFNVPLYCPAPFICTVHDLILHRYPNQAGFFRRGAYRFVLRRALQRARSIVSVSNATQADIAKNYASAAGKVRVIYPGIEERFIRASEEAIKAVRARYRLDRPFLLYVGNGKQHKNVPVLIEAFSRAALPDFELILVGNHRERSNLSLRSSVRIEDGILEQDLPALYSAAEGFVTATLSEGFGFPVLEAMACRCPVLGTTCGSLPEVCGSNALLTDPSVEAIANGMRRLVSDKSLRSPERLLAAEQQTKTFRWERSADAAASLIAASLPHP